jgi:hypothetical protein
MSLIKAPLTILLHSKLSDSQRDATRNAAASFSRFSIELDVCDLSKNPLPPIRNRPDFGRLVESPNSQIVKGNYNLLGSVFGPHPMNSFGVLVDPRPIVSVSGSALIGSAESDQRSSFKIIGAVVSAAIDVSLFEPALKAQVFKLVLKSRPNYQCPSNGGSYRSSASCIVSSSDEIASFSASLSMGQDPCPSCIKVVQEVLVGLSYCGAA